MNLQAHTVQLEENPPSATVSNEAGYFAGSNGITLADLFQSGRTGKIDAKMHGRILVRLDRLGISEKPEDMDLPGFDFHPLQGAGTLISFSDDAGTLDLNVSVSASAAAHITQADFLFGALV